MTQSTLAPYIFLTSIYGSKTRKVSLAAEYVVCFQSSGRKSATGRTTPPRIAFVALLSVQYEDAFA